VDHRHCESLVLEMWPRGEDSSRINHGTTHKVWVVLAENEVAGVLVDGVSDIQISDKWSTEKTGDVCVVHAVCFKNLANQTRIWDEEVPEPKPSTSKAYTCP
jgi:hypothetical protein